MFRSIYHIVFWGTDSTANGQISRKVLFSNVIYLSLAFVYFIFLILDFNVYLNNPLEWAFDQTTVPLMIVICLLCVLLNKRGHSLLTRIGFLILWPLLMHILPIIFLNTPSDYYIAYPLGLLFYSIIIQLILSVRFERIPYYTFLFISLFLILSSKEFMLHFDLDPPNDPNGPVGSSYYMFVIFIYWLLLSTITFYVNVVLDGLIERNEDQNRNLLALNNQIEQTNVSLEEKVRERTSELLQINDTLTNYAYYNAHEIKGPFCRIQGLYMLKFMSAIDDKTFNEKMSICLEELDFAINEMQLKLNSFDKN